MEPNIVGRHRVGEGEVGLPPLATLSIQGNLTTMNEPLNNISECLNNFQKPSINDKHNPTTDVDLLALICLIALESVDSI
ncbi:hypothetical protein ACTXT7_004647 [Hymenolepis weldensis]